MTFKELKDRRAQLEARLDELKAVDPIDWTA
jgi:hypothetical protein